MLYSRYFISCKNEHSLGLKIIKVRALYNKSNERRRPRGPSQRPKQGENNEWRCRRCDEIFSSESKLRKHRRSTHPPNEDGAEEEKYKYEDTENGDFRCITCDEEFPTLIEVKKHIEEHEARYKCEPCNIFFKEPYKYSLHSRVHNDDGLVFCPLCDYKSNRLTSMSTHIRHHENNYRYRCDECGQGFNNVQAYKEHNNFHMGVKPFGCEVCGKYFMYSSYLLSHQIRNHDVRIDQLEGYQCAECDKRFEKERNLKQHLKSHKKKIKNKLCDICGMGFSVKEKLTIHRRVHTGEKPYSCQYCSKCFTKRDYLIMHERVHTGEKPYTCEFCDKSFNQAAPLRIHRRNHTGERPYVCHICASKFISKTALNIHYRACNG